MGRSSTSSFEKINYHECSNYTDLGFPDKVNPGLQQPKQPVIMRKLAKLIRM
jgi:hypothetical protein